MQILMKALNWKISGIELRSVDIERSEQERRRASVVYGKAGKETIFSPQDSGVGCSMTATDNDSGSSIAYLLNSWTFIFDPTCWIIRIIMIMSVFEFFRFAKLIFFWFKVFQFTTKSKTSTAVYLNGRS